MTTTTLELTAHRRQVLALTLMHELERDKERYTNPHPLSSDLRHNTREAAAEVLALLRDVHPLAAESWERHNGHPYKWGQS